MREPLRQPFVVHSFEIVFHRESVFGEKVVSRSRELPAEGGRAFTHGLLAEGRDDELVRVRSRWMPR